MKTFQIKGDDISDGHHTFRELYEHRCLLFINICLMNPRRATWKQDYEAWFCLYWESPTGQISYHCPNKLLYLVRGKIREDKDYKWDQHSPGDVVNRLHQLAVSRRGISL